MNLGLSDHSLRSLDMESLAFERAKDIEIRARALTRICLRWLT